MQITSVLLSFALFSFVATTSKLAAAAAAPRASLKAKDVISSVPRDDLGLFIRYHLSLASQGILAAKSLSAPPIPIDKVKAFQEIPTPETFSKDLTHWITKKFNLTSSDVHGLVASGVICFPTGCINANDIGSLCCPF